MEYSKGRISKSVIRNILGRNPSQTRLSLDSLRDNSIWTSFTVFNGYLVANDHSLYTNRYLTASSFIHHYFGSQTTRDLADGGLVIALRNLESGIEYQYSELPFDKQYDFFGIALQNRQDGVSFWKANGLAFIKSFSTRSSARELPLDHRMWMDFMMDCVQIASYQNLIIFNKFAAKFIIPIGND